MNTSFRPPCEKMLANGKNKMIKSTLLSICKFTQAKCKEVYLFVKLTLDLGEFRMSKSAEIGGTTAPALMNKRPCRQTHKDFLF